MELSDRKFLVMGGAGFLGSHVVEELAARDVPRDRIFVPRSAEYDLTEEDDVERVYRDAGPDVVVHLAATVGGIGANRRYPGRFFYDNMAMGLHVMEHARRHGVEKFVNIGTVCAYPKHTPVPFREEDLFEGYPEETNAPYGIANRALLVQGWAYREQYDFEAIFLLPVNLYGPRDDFDPETSHVIPALIRKCLEAKDAGQDEIVAWGDGSPTREFFYVEDAAEAIVTATERYRDPEPMNLGTGREISIRELLQTIVELTGYEGEIVWDTDKPNGQPRRCLDVSRARECLGFEASTDLREGLERTIAWYEEDRDRGPLR